jgi:hypothetical protein
VNPAYIPVIVLADIVVTFVVLQLVLARRGGIAGFLRQARLYEAARADLERETQEWLGANWSGDPASLPAAIEPLLVKLEADLTARGVTASRMQLKLLVSRVIMRQGSIGAGEVREAMRQVA